MQQENKDLVDANSIFVDKILPEEQSRYMSKEWKDKGMTGSISNMLSSILPGAIGHLVQNKKTEKTRGVWKGSNQSVGDAIKKGQFNDRKSRKK